MDRDAHVSLEKIISNKQNVSKNRSNAAMNASKKKATKSLKKMERGLEQDLQSLAKNRNTKSINKQKFNRNRDSQEGSYNGGRIDRFPRGNKQGMGFGNKQSIIVQESEYIGEVTSNSTAFSLLNSYPINPGQVKSFPWLSTIAKNYEKYEFLSLQWVYKPEVSQYATNGQTGKILMSVDYDASDAPPQNKQQMEDVVPHSDAMPYQQLKLNCRPKEMHSNSDAKFVRPGNLPGQSDIKTYDAGNLFLGTSGISTNAGVLGELHVKYIVKLSIPILESNSVPVNNSVTLFQSVNEPSGATTVPTQMLMATIAVNQNGLNAVNTAGSIVLPPGNYLIDITGSSLNTTTGMTLYQLSFFKNGVQYGPTVFESEVGGAVALSCTINTYVSVLATDTLTLQSTVTYTSGTNTQSINFRIISI